ncbi:hypothetical protein BGX24_011703 [Mortierella sp. AD032]|nr:hypothetical protein BGX24_011703 [Mortierella sp. AD032]
MTPSTSPSPSCETSTLPSLPTTTTTKATTTTTTNTTLSSLPTECLQLILAYHRFDLTLLHALLLVSRTFFQLAVPLLYQSPFALIKASSCDRFPYEKSMRQVKLLWLLLCSVNHLPWVRQELPPFSEELLVLWNPNLSQEDLERLGFGGSQSSSSKDVQVASRKTTHGSNSNIKTARFLTVDYLSFYTHHNHSTISDSLPSLFPSLICYHMDQWSSSTDMIRIRATIERALLMHRPEGIVSLAVPITRVKAVQEAVADAVTASATNMTSGSGLSRLRRVEFYGIRQEFSLEDVLAFLRSLRRPPSSPSLSSSLSPSPQGTGTGTGKGTEGGEGRMLLTEIKIGGPTDYGHIGKRDLYTILQELTPTLQNIDLTDWRGAIMDLDQIPTEQVRVLHMRLDRMVPDSTDVGGFLKRAGRTLRDLQMCIGPGHGGLFRWAVEKKRKQSNASLRRIASGSGGSESESRERQEERQALACKVDKELEDTFGSKDDAEDDGEEEDTSDDSTGDDDDDDDDDDDEDEAAMDTRASPTRLHFRDTTATAYEDEEGLRNLSLAGETPSVLWGLMGATSAYYDRLETLAASSWKQQISDRPGSLPDGASAAGGSQGQGGEGSNNGNNNNDTSLQQPPLPRLYFSATMTRLVHLDLKGEIASTSFDMRTLALCPVLLRLKLDTYKSSLSPSQQPPALNRIPELLDNVCESVCELELVGSWTVTDRELDRMGRGGVLPRLRKLVLSHCRTRVESWEIEEEGEGEGVDEEGVFASTSMSPKAAVVARIPDYLLAAMPLQQDIGPSVPASAPVSSRTRSRTSKPGSTSKNSKSTSTSSPSKSKSKSKSKSSTTPAASATSPRPLPPTSTGPPSARRLSALGLVRAVDYMTDLHYLHIEILNTTRGPYGLRDDSQSLMRSSSPYPNKSIFEGLGGEEERKAEEYVSCLDEKSLLKAFGDHRGRESRAFPLEIEVLECRES